VSNENPRLGRKHAELLPHQFTRHCGRYHALNRRIRRDAAKQAGKGRAGIREVAPYLMKWIRDTRALRVGWDYLEQFGGQSAGIDGLRFGDLPESEVWRILRDIKDQIRNGDYKPAADRVIEISKGPGRGNRKLAIPCIFDRCVQRAVVEVLQPYLDPLFDPLSFGFRPGRGVIQAVAHACHFFHTEGRRVWVTADLRDAFCRVPLSRLMDVLRYYVGSDDVVAFVCQVLSGSATAGLRQGGPLSPLLLNLYLHHNLDQKWRQLYPDIPLLRYADDILLMCRTVAEAKAAHDHLVELVLPAGMTVKGDRKSDVVTLTAKRPALWLGYEFVSLSRKSLRVTVAEKSWASLAENLELAHEAPDAPLRAWASIKSWIADKGPCYQFTDFYTAWVRMRDIAANLAFDEVPDCQTVDDWWQRAYARWCRLCNEIAATANEPA
jgi:RNA-directed DNA polymerase